MTIEQAYKQINALRSNLISLLADINQKRSLKSYSVEELANQLIEATLSDRCVYAFVHKTDIGLPQSKLITEKLNKLIVDTTIQCQETASRETVHILTGKIQAYKEVLRLLEE